jgi:transposase
MPIVGGLDIHRKQLTFDYLDTVTGEVKQGQIAPADRAHLRAWLARFAGRDDVAFALEGCTGWRYVAEELSAAGCAAHVAEPADTAAARGGKSMPRPTRPTPGTCGSCWPRAGSRSAGSRPVTSWNAGRCWSCITICGPSTRRRRSCAVFFHQGAPQLSAGALRTEQGTAAVRAAAAAHLSPAGQLQVATALDMLTCLEGHLEELRHRLLVTARHLTGAKVLTARLYGVGPVTALAMTSWLGGAGRFSSSRKAVRFAGLDITVYSSDSKRSPGHLSRQGPAVLRWTVYEAGKVHARSCAPDHAYYAAVKDRKDGKRAALSEARKIIRQGCHILAELGDDALSAA